MGQARRRGLQGRAIDGAWMQSSLESVRKVTLNCGRRSKDIEVV
jgi:hypothetical protein